MATLASTNLTLLDWGKRVDPNGSTADIVEMLAQSNEMLMDIPYMEGNLPTGHRTTIRSGLPNVFWRMINQPARKSKSRTTQVDEQAALLEVWSEIDEELVNLAGTKGAEARLREASSFIEAMSQEMQRAYFYGGNSVVAPAEFPGFAQRYTTLTGNIGQNVLNAGGAGTDNSSIWLVCWGPRKVMGLFPKGTKAGLERRDWGLQAKDETNDEVLAVYREQFKWRTGLCLEDWRYAVRIANIDIPSLSMPNPVNLLELMAKAIHRLPNMSGKVCFYANRTIIQHIDIQRMRLAVSGTGISYMEVDGKLIPHFRGIPIRRVDQLIETEETVA